MLLRSRITRVNSRSRGYERVWGSSSSRSLTGTSWTVVDWHMEDRIRRRNGAALKVLIHIMKRRPRTRGIRREWNCIVVGLDFFRGHGGLVQLR